MEKRKGKQRKRRTITLAIIGVLFFAMIPAVIILMPREKSQAVSCYNWKTKQKYAKSDVTMYVRGKKISVSDTPIVVKNGIDLFPLSKSTCGKISGLSYEYNERAKHVRLVYRNHVVTFVAGEKTYYADGRKHTFETAPVKVYYNKPKSYYIAAPLKAVFEGLAMTAVQEEGSRRIDISSQKEVITGRTVRTSYAYSRSVLAAKEYKKFPKTSKKNYRKLLTVSKDKTGKFQFLQVNTYREVDEEYYEKYFNYKIYDYCREAKISIKKSVLYGKAAQMLKTAKKYNIDPVYFACQTFVESAYGTSVLARGVKSGRKKVYNLYGIKAYDSAPVRKGAAYAKKMGWTTIAKAIDGAASYLDTQYIRSKYKQNTIFKIRFQPGKSLWHQYASDPYYADKIGTQIYRMSHVYSEEAGFVFDYPKYGA